MKVYMKLITDGSLQVRFKQITVDNEFAALRKDG